MQTTPSPNSATGRRAFVLGTAGALAGLVASSADVLARPGAAYADGGRRPEHAHDRTKKRIERLIASMTLQEKVGQLFVNVVYGATAETEDPNNTSLYGVSTPAEVIAKYHLGGVIYFVWAHNVNDPVQVAGLSNGLQAAAIASGASIPLLLSADQEQGPIVRLGPPATQFPSSMGLAASRCPENSEVTARITGQELAAVGINQDNAPDADVNINPANPVIGVRSFGSNPKLVSTFVVEEVKGYQNEAHILATAKHFPGHGDTTVDSHTGIPVITHTREQWETIDAPPFEAAIKAGVGCIMTGHLVFPALDPSEDPATLSYPIVTGLLRDQLGFEGLVITDALTMAGVRQKYGDARIPVLALKAGCDLLLMPPLMDVAFDAVVGAVRDGEISESRLDESLRRILGWKFGSGIVCDPFVDVDKVNEIVGTPAHLARADEIADQVITLIKNDDDLLPLPDSISTVLVTGSGETALSTFVTEFDARGVTPTKVVTGTKPTDDMIAASVAAARLNDLVVVCTQNAWDTTTLDPEGRQQRLVHELVATGTPVVAIAISAPYDIAHFTEVSTFLADYAGNAVTTKACVRVMFGEVNPRGKLPVSIPTAADPKVTLYPYGWGLSYDPVLMSMGR
ncbi:beta-N-acetylhexosaminidase [Actinopolymorpha cephalotaxi]|uniref:beta-N-acetylhexosaminidase n=1 Tax=Actinopolymorpha cephalotaxi TaxID=504797 RepID=A0A1I2K2K7_9ACTN|nr:glycoside hydrolase family 3 protein [Actinopolymorpha cephalotaxi]NYH85979.1 beta-N-acetylhexosaminidase [Actinopolymorpha cephalotaxi]SFF61435.1 beta-N-acetylhexosaminidase [Actinopolymorpha cephalotaxi]